MKLLISTIIGVFVVVHAQHEQQQQQFSASPSKLPVKKIFVHGAQTFNPYQPANPPPAWQGYQSNIPSYGFQQGQSQNAAVSGFQGQGQNNAGQGQGQSNGQSSAVQQQLQQQSQSQFQQNQLPSQSGGAANAGGAAGGATGVRGQDALVSGQGAANAGPGFPLQECFTNTDGFMCCNGQLEQTINDAYDELKKSRNGKWSPCNIQQIANKISEATEKRFNTTFEVLAGVDDFSSKSHFYHNYICKVERDSRFILAYATPRKDRLPQDIPPPPAETYAEPEVQDPYAPPPPPPAYGPPPESPYRSYTYTWRARVR